MALLTSLYVKAGKLVCPACDAKGKLLSGHPTGFFTARCEKCGAEFGEIDRTQAKKLIPSKWFEGEELDLDETVPFDYTVSQPAYFAPLYRVHGWMHLKTRRATQIG